MLKTKLIVLLSLIVTTSACLENQRNQIKESRQQSFFNNASTAGIPLIKKGNTKDENYILNTIYNKNYSKINRLITLALTRKYFFVTSNLHSYKDAKKVGFKEAIDELLKGNYVAPACDHGGKSAKTIGSAKCKSGFYKIEISQSANGKLNCYDLSEYKFQKGVLYYQSEFVKGWGFV